MREMYLFSSCPVVLVKMLYSFDAPTESIQGRSVLRFFEVNVVLFGHFVCRFI